jgi:hypothetical protein
MKVVVEEGAIEDVELVGLTPVNAAARRYS